MDLNYNQINSFLDKFKKILFQKEEVKHIVQDVISREVAHQISENDIKIKTPTIYVVGSPILKSEILIHRNKIIEELNKRIPNNKILYIR